MNILNLTKEKKVSVPTGLLQRFYKTVRSFSDIADEFEDLLMSKNKETIKKLRKAQKEKQVGKLKSFSSLT